MDNEQLKSKIAREIMQSGYPLGFYTRQAIYQNRWNLSGQREYLTKDGAHREIDVEAFLQDHYETPLGQGFVTSLLICECKTNKENPRVFFREEPAFRKLHNIEFSSRAQEEKFLKGLMEESKGYHLSNPKSVSTEWIVALCSNDKRNRQIYEGIDTLIGCVEFYKRSAEKKFKERDLRQFFMALVYDGELFEASISGDDVSVNEIEHIVVRTSRTDENRYYHYAIDIVRKTFLNSYLDYLQKDHLAVYECLKQGSISASTSGDSKAL